MTSIRAALTETRNVYAPMPDRVDQLDELRGRLADVIRVNVDHHVGLMREAKRLGAGAIGFGELFASPYFGLTRHPVWLDAAEELDGPTLATLSAAARDLAMVVVAPIYEREGEQRFNTALVIDADGALIGSFRKLHIPEGNNEQGEFHEPYYYRRSDGSMRQHADKVTGFSSLLPVFETAVGNIGVAICYDRHFEGVMSGLAHGGAQLVFSPAVTFGAKSRRMWEMEFAVDATRHRLFIGGSNRRGVEPPFRQEYFGQSHFVGPNGKVKNVSDHPNLIVADLDFDELTSTDPSGWDLQRDRRDLTDGSPSP